MKKTKFTETQIVKAIQDHEAGRKAEDICRELTEGSFFYLMIKTISKIGSKLQTDIGGQVKQSESECMNLTSDIQFW